MKAKPSALENYLFQKLEEAGLIKKDLRQPYFEFMENSSKLNMPCDGYSCDVHGSFELYLSTLDLTKSFNEPGKFLVFCSCYRRDGKADIRALDIMNCNTNFMKGGNRKASSTYLKIPIAVCDKYIPLNSSEDIDKWVANLASELPFLQAQCKALTGIKKQIKTQGAEYKAVMKKYQKRTPEWKQAREAYENMIIRFMTKLTRREEILIEDRHFAATH